MAPVQPVGGVGPRHLRCQTRAPGPDTLPQFVVDDAQFRHLAHLVLAGIFEPDDAPAGARVFLEASAVPHETANIDRVVQDAGAALLMAANRGVDPTATAWSRNALSVQRFRDLTRRRAGGVVAKDPADDLCLIRQDAARAPLAAARRRRHDAVAEGETAGDPSSPHTAELAAPGFVPQIREELLRHRAEQADVEFADASL
nr:hypothetical protein [Roseomonas rubea]